MAGIKCGRLTSTIVNINKKNCLIFNLVDFLLIRQTAKLNSTPNFTTIRYPSLRESRHIHDDCRAYSSYASAMNDTLTCLFPWIAYTVWVTSYNADTFPHRTTSLHRAFSMSVGTVTMDTTDTTSYVNQKKKKINHLMRTVNNSTTRHVGEQCTRAPTTWYML